MESKAKNWNDKYTETEDSFNDIFRKKHINKYEFREDVEIKVKQEDKWINIYNDPNLDWKHIYLTPIRATIDTTLRDFQYKFIMQIIPTNSFLLKCKISNSNLCDFCNNSIETVVHLFLECQHSQHFWSQLKTFLTEFKVLEQYGHSCWTEYFLYYLKEYTLTHFFWKF